MQEIKHQINHFLFEIFPELVGKSNEEMIQYMKDYYAVGMFKPQMLQELQLPFDNEYEMAKMMKG